MSTIVLRSLGDCAIDVGGNRIDPGKKIIFAALLRLVAEPSNVLPRSDLQTLLWPNIRDTQARQRLRQTLYTLKRAGVCLEPDDANIGITSSNVALDFRDAIACASRGIGPLLTSFLPGYAPSISDAFEGWLESFREQVHLQIRNALLTTIRIQRQNAAW